MAGKEAKNENPTAFIFKFEPEFMNWFKQIGQTEYLLLGIFFFLYLVFLIRSWLISRRLQSKVSLIWIKFFLRTAFFALVIVSILGPSFGGIKKEVKAVGKDIFIALDLSQSINCTDVQPSRLEKIKFEIKKVLEAFSGDRVGLIVFASDAYLYCPFTFDKSALQTLLETANSKVIGDGGTDFGKALELAGSKFKENEINTKKISSKLVLLISDGEDFGEETEDAISKLEKEGVKVFTLGVGTKEGAKVPILGTEDFILDENGEAVLAKLKSEDMRKISTQTGGKYFEVTNDKNEVPALIEAMDSIEGEVWDVQTIDIGANKYFYFLFLALAILLLDILFTINIIRI
jgi:Ca-activated chloride channel family protein